MQYVYYGMKSLTTVTFLALISLFMGGGCSIESEFDPSIYQNLPEAQWYLTEYRQDDELLYSFTYLGRTLQTQTLHGPNGDIEFHLEYGNGNLPVKMRAEIRERVYDLFYFYEDDLLQRMEFQIDGEERVRFLLFYNDFNKIETVIEEYRSGFVNEISYQWEGDNIKLYQVHNQNTSNEVDLVFEFEYDDKRNPFSNVYQDVGYDFFQNLPISANNWTRQVVYRKGTPELYSVYNNTIEYWGPNYPLFTTTEFIDENGQVYTSKVDFSY